LNIKEYISSGILESYALGELSDPKRLEVEKNLEVHPELRAELALIEKTIEAFYVRAGKEPKPHLKEKIRASIIKPKVIRMWVPLAAAAAILIAVLVGYNFWSEYRIMNGPEFTKVVMTGMKNSPDAMATVYWNKSTSESYLMIQNLKVLSKEQQYQLWAIVDGKPVDMGVFDSGKGLHRMGDVEGTATAFAVTIEPRGGKPAPTMETMQVFGNT